MDSVDILATELADLVLMSKECNLWGCIHQVRRVIRIIQKTVLHVPDRVKNEMNIVNEDLQQVFVCF
jgi:hypothetical protein